MRILHFHYITLKVSYYHTQIVTYLFYRYLCSCLFEIQHLVTDKVIHQRHFIYFSDTGYIYRVSNISQVHVKHIVDGFRI